MDLSLKELRYLSPSMTLASKRSNPAKFQWNNKEAWEPEKWILRHIPDLLPVDLTSFLASGASFRTKDVSENLVTYPLLVISHSLIKSSPPQERMI